MNKKVFFNICAVSENYCISQYIVYNMDRACKNTQKLIGKLTKKVMFV